MKIVLKTRPAGMGQFIKKSH